MSAFSYRSIQAPAEGMYKEKGSKFLAFAYPVNSVDDIKAKLTVLKKEFFDARHHCFAWMLGPEKKLFRAFDDGEPNHSAGDPILGQIRSKDITNVLVVVVRYFGGIKLGVGGLINAYKAAAEDVLNNVVIIEMEVTEQLTFIYDYAFTAEVMKLVKDFQLTIKSQDFKELCKLQVEFRLRSKEKLMEKIALLQALGNDLKIVSLSI